MPASCGLAVATTRLAQVGIRPNIPYCTIGLSDREPHERAQNPAQKAVNASPWLHHSATRSGIVRSPPALTNALFVKLALATLRVATPPVGSASIAKTPITWNSSLTAQPTYTSR